MSNEVQVPVRKLIWTNILFFAVTTLLGVVGTPLYFLHRGVSLFELVLFGFFLLATPLSITMGYHRLYAHMTYKANPLVQFLFLFFGAAAFEQSALKWASQHRTHHQFVDTDKDPYSIKKGFFYAHIGWLIFWKQSAHFDNVPDLQRNRLVMHQHRHYMLWSVASGVLLPVLIGAAAGHALGAFLFAVCLRLTLVYHGTFCINSVCHMFGKATYDIYSSAKDHWFAALITFGEGYHNYHHHFPADYRNGVRWYHWDPTKWLIALLVRVGLASDPKKISSYKILAARLRARHQAAEDTFRKLKEMHPALEAIRQKLQMRYERLKDMLTAWEHHAADYRYSLCKKKLNEAQFRFKQSLREWEILYAVGLRFANR